MKEIGDMDVGELAAYVATHLESKGIHVVLTGGTCVSIYSKGKYVSKDIDFIDDYFTPTKKVAAALAETGFIERNRYFIHPETDLLIEFPAGPLSVGDEPVKQIDTLSYKTGNLKIISPTDCIKDRLAAFFHWNDRQSLEQALLVALDNDVDIEEIDGWSEREGHASEFQEFTNLLNERLVQEKR